MTDVPSLLAELGRRAAAVPLLAVYIGSVVLANWLTTHYGLTAVGFGLTATAGTFAIGGAIMTRDLLQDAAGRIAVLLAMAVAALVSFAVADEHIAAASAITFAVAETAEFLIYTPLRRRARIGGPRWAGSVTVANAVGVVIDTLLFLHLAGFPVTERGVAGQLVGKAWVTLAVLTIAGGARALRDYTVRAEGA